MHKGITKCAKRLFPIALACAAALLPAAHVAWAQSPLSQQQILEALKTRPSVRGTRGPSDASAAPAPRSLAAQSGNSSMSWLGDVRAP
jgi:hypothetical protein